MKDLVEVTNGFPFDATRFSGSEGTPLIRIRDLLRGCTETYFDGAVPDVAIVEDGDLLVGMDGDFNSGIWTGGRAALNQRMCRLRARPGLNQRFLRYVVDLPLRYINDLTYATTVKHLSSTDLLNERIPLPPIEEQRAIADYLDTETARIDALIAKKQRMIEVLEERTNSAFLEGVLGERLQGRNSLSGYYALVPDGWSETSLRHLGCEVQTGPFGSQLHAGDYIQDGWPVVNPMNIIKGSIEPVATMTVSNETRDQLSRHILRPGDIVFGRRGEMGRAGLVEERHAGWLCGTGSLRLRLTGGYLLPEYLKLLLGTAPARAYFGLASVGSTMDNLNSEIVLAFPCLVPPLETQRKVIREAAMIEVRSQRLRDRVEQQVSLLLERRQALITAAVTGELEVAGVTA